MGTLIGILLIVLFVGAVAGVVGGVAYAGYVRRGIPGAVIGALFAGWMLYLIGWPVLRSHWLSFSKAAADAAEQYLRQAQPSGTVRVSRRHRGKFHRVEFRCQRCKASNSTRQTIAEQYAFLCVSCGYPHRVVYKSWLAP